MKALLLNSGLGKRMKELTIDCPKTMIKIQGNDAIIDRQINYLRKLGIKDFVITTGAFSEKLTSYLLNQYADLNFKFIYNDLYDKTNYIYSIYLAKEYLDDDLILMHGDLVFDFEILKKIVYASYSSMIVSSTLPLPEKDFKARIENNKIIEIGINIFENCYAAQPLYKLLKAEWMIWLNSIQAFCEKGIVDCYAENALNEITDLIHLNPLDIKSDFCFEIDNLQDLDKVKKYLG